MIRDDVWYGGYVVQESDMMGGGKTESMDWRPCVKRCYACEGKSERLQELVRIYVCRDWL